MIGRKCHSTVPGVTKGELVEEFRGPLCYASQHGGVLAVTCVFW